MEYWSWVLTAVGLTGFVLAGKKVWWCWYVNIACQALWMTYAIVSEQWGFIVAALAYTFVFTKNAIAWTKEHRQKWNFDYNTVVFRNDEDIVGHSFSSDCDPDCYGQKENCFYKIEDEPRLCVTQPGCRRTGVCMHPLQCVNGLKE